MIMKNNHNHKSPPSSMSNNSMPINEKNSVMPSSSSSSSSSSTSSSCSSDKQTETTNIQTLTAATTTNTTSSSNNNNQTSYIPTKLYVTNFPFTCTQRQIQDLFSQYGQVVECTLKKDYYAYILFTSVKSSLNAYKHANGLKMFGRKLTVHLATSKKSQSHLQNTHQLLASLNLLLTDSIDDESDLQIPFEQIPKIIHVRNFPETCTQQQVRDLFVQYGDIVECLILHDSYAFVHFKSAIDARLALQSTNNQPFMNSNTNLLVQYSRSKFKLQNTTELPTNRTNNYRNSCGHEQHDLHVDECDYDNEYDDEFDEHYENSQNKNDNESNQSQSMNSTRTKLYVTNFPDDMDQEEMKQLFNQYGQVLECTIMWNQYAFVHFGSYSEAEKALNATKGTQYKGYKISVQWSTSSKYQQPKQHHTKQNGNQENSIKILERPVNSKPDNQSWASLVNKTSPNFNNSKQINVNNTSSSSQPFKISFSEIVRSSSQNGPQVIKKVESEIINEIQSSAATVAKIVPIVNAKPEEPIKEEPKQEIVIETQTQSLAIEKPVIGPIGTQQKSQNSIQPRQINNNSNSNYIQKRTPSSSQPMPSTTQSQAPLIQIPPHHFQTNVHYGQPVLFDSHNIAQQQQPAMINPLVNHTIPHHAHHAHHHHHPSHHIHHQIPPPQPPSQMSHHQNYDYQSVQHNYYNQQQAPIEMYQYANPHHPYHMAPPHQNQMVQPPPQPPQAQQQYPNQAYYTNQFAPTMINNTAPPPPPLLPQPHHTPYYYNTNPALLPPPPPPSSQQTPTHQAPVWNDNQQVHPNFNSDSFGLTDRQYHVPHPQTQYSQQELKEPLIQPGNNQFTFNDYSNGLLMKQTNTNTVGSSLLTNGFANLTISSSTAPSTSSRSSSSSSSSSSNNFITNGNSASNSGSSSSTPTANQTKSTTPKMDSATNGLSSLFNSYVLFPSDSFDLSNDQLNAENDEKLNQQQLNNQQQFYQIEDVLANLIR